MLHQQIVGVKTELRDGKINLQNSIDRLETGIRNGADRVDNIKLTLENTIDSELQKETNRVDNIKVDLENSIDGVQTGLQKETKRIDGINISLKNSINHVQMGLQKETKRSQDQKKYQKTQLIDRFHTYMYHV